MGLDVFISYRRADGAEAARLIAGALQSRNLSVFLDVTDLEADHFDESLLRRIAEARCFIPILTKQSFERPDSQSDWFYREIRHALSAGRSVIPIMMPGFLFPPAEQMPAGMETLSRHQSITYSHEFFDAWIEKLVGYFGLPTENKATCPIVSSPWESPELLPTSGRRVEAKFLFRKCTFSVAVSPALAVCAWSYYFHATLLLADPKTTNGTNATSNSIVAPRIAPSTPPTPTPTSPPVPSQYWPKKVILKDIGPEPSRIEVLADGKEDGKEAKFEYRPGDERAEVLLDEALREKRFSDAKSLQLRVISNDYRPFVMPLAAGSQDSYSYPGAIIRIRQTGFVKVSGERVPLFSALRFTQIGGLRSESAPIFYSLKTEALVELKTGHYEVDLHSEPGNGPGVDVADRHLPGEVVVEAGKTAELTLPVFEFPPVMAGYVRTEWKNVPFKYFRSLTGKSYDLGVSQNINFYTWSPVVWQFDKSYTAGDMYEAHNVASSYFVPALESMLGNSEKDSRAISVDAIKIMRALALAEKPTAEGVMAANAQLLKSTQALKAIVDRNKSASEEASKCFDYFSVLSKATTLPSWQKLIRACFSNGKVSAADLAELSKTPPNHRLGYLVKSHFQVKRSTAEGSIEIEMRRHSVDMQTWKDTGVSDWNPTISTKKSGGSHSIQISGRWLGGLCAIEFEELKNASQRIPVDLEPSHQEYTTLTSFGIAMTGAFGPSAPATGFSDTGSGRVGGALQPLGSASVSSQPAPPTVVQTTRNVANEEPAQARTRRQPAEPTPRRKHAVEEKSTPTPPMRLTQKEKNTTAVPTALTPAPPPAQVPPEENSPVEVDKILDTLPLGSMSYQVPEPMSVNRADAVKLLVSPTESVEELKSSLEQSGTVAGNQVRVARLMEPRLSGAEFEITPEFSSEPLAISSSEPTSWVWTVRPLSPGKHHLRLKLDAILSIAGKERRRSVEVFDKQIEVSVETLPKSTNWQPHPLFLTLGIGLPPLLLGLSGLYWRAHRKTLAPQVTLRGTSSAEIFVSYARRDLHRILPIVEKLRTEGYAVWIDVTGIDAATYFDEEIARAINAAKIIILAASQNSLNSTYVARELRLASEESKTVIPLFLETATIPPFLRLQLAGVQRIELGAGIDEAFQQLLHGLERAGVLPKPKVDPDA